MPIKNKPIGVILVGFIPNPRICKRIAAEQQYLDVHLICWDRANNMLAVPNYDAYRTHIIRIPAINDPLKRLIPYAKFRAVAKKQLRIIHPDVIHVQGLDMLKIACSYKKHVNDQVHIIYEVADLHRLIVDVPKQGIQRLAHDYLLSQDRRCCQKIDLLIVTCQKYVDSYFENFVSPEKTLLIPNMPDLAVFSEYHKKPKETILTVGYIGAIRYKKQMENLVIAARNCGCKLMIAGYENTPCEIEKMCAGISDIEWVGRFNFAEQVASLYQKCDVMYSVYDADIQNVRVAIPNKLYESVYCEMPLIVAKGTYLAEKVDEWGVGVAVDHKNLTELISILKKMQNDNDYYMSFVRNCKKHKHLVDIEPYNNELQKKIEKMIDSMVPEH